MSHLLHSSERVGARPVGRPYAAVLAEKRGDALQVVDRVVLIKPDAQVVRLPDRIRILSGDSPIEPTWGFWISVETMDPYHAILDWDGS